MSFHENKQIAHIHQIFLQTKTYQVFNFQAVKRREWATMLKKQGR